MHALNAGMVCERSCQRRSSVPRRPRRMHWRISARCGVASEHRMASLNRVAVAAAACRDALTRPASSCCRSEPTCASTGHRAAEPAKPFSTVLYGFMRRSWGARRGAASAAPSSRVRRPSGRRPWLLRAARLDAVCLLPRRWVVAGAVNAAPEQRAAVTVGVVAVRPGEAEAH